MRQRLVSVTKADTKINLAIKNEVPWSWHPVFLSTPLFSCCPSSYRLPCDYLPAQCSVQRTIWSRYCSAWVCDALMKWTFSSMIYILFLSSFQHLLSHFPPQYECLGCNRKFVYRCGLKTHLQQVHKFMDWENYIRKEPREENLAIDY